LSNSDTSQDTPRAAPASHKPSLLGETLAPATTPKPGEKSTRMLNELESLGGHRKSGSSRTLAMWIGGAALVLAAGAAWWSQQRTAQVTTPKPSVGQQTATTNAAAPATSAIKTGEAPNATGRTARAASAPTEAAPSVARIETTAAPSTAPAVAAGSTLAVAAAAVPALSTTTTNGSQKPPASAAPPVAKPKAAKTAKSAKSAKATRLAKQQKKTKQQLAKAKKNQPSAAPTTRVAQAAPNVKAGSATGASKDADILLLSALLAHVSRDAQAGPTAAPTAAQAQQTIAQIVQRCEARGGKDTLETTECRRRICDGYWGKAQACPASLAPKKE
jgi:hypothetical protein